MPDTNQPDPTPTPALEIDPADVLTERVVNLLTPAFLDPAKGDEDLARAAAFKALCDYYENTPGDLLSIAQTILFGLATIEATGRSLAPNVADATFLRLTGRANALARSEARARKAMLEYSIPRSQPELPDWSTIPEPEQPPEEAEPEAAPQAAAPPARTPAEAPINPSSSDHHPFQTAPTPRSAGTTQSNSVRAQALASVSYPVMIGAHPEDGEFLPGTPAEAALAALYATSKNGSGVMMPR